MLNTVLNLFKVNKNDTRKSPNRANNPANIYFFKVNNKNTRKRCEICSNLTIKLGNISLFKANDRNTRKSSEICSKLTVRTPEEH